MKEWKPPLRCRPYSKLEALNNQPEVHGGNEEYWNQKRRSVVPPKVSFPFSLPSSSRKGLKQTGRMSDATNIPQIFQRYVIIVFNVSP